MTRNERLKIRYQVYRKLGYDSITSRALSQRSLDISNLEISKKTGKLKRNKTTKKFIEHDMEQWKRDQVINKYTDRISDIPNDTVYTRHGMLTHDKRYRGENGKIISIIRHENKLTTDQAYYFFYYMNTNKKSYTETKKELLSARDFEQNMSGKATEVQKTTTNRLRKNQGLAPLKFVTRKKFDIKEERYKAHKKH